MLAYHGTGIQDIEKLKSEGLKPLEPREVAKQVLARYANQMHRIPKWAMRHLETEIRYREQQGKVVHLTLSKRQAATYSRHRFGGEFETSLCACFDKALRRKSSWEPKKDAVTHVLVVEIPDDTPYIDRTIGQMRDTHPEREGFVFEAMQKSFPRYAGKKKSWEEFADETSWDIRVPEIKPEQIVAILPVNGEDN